jgi:hypothetical protein
MYLAPQPTEVDRWAAFMRRMQLPRPAAEAKAILERNGMDWRRANWRLQSAKKAAGIESYRIRVVRDGQVRTGWGWRRADRRASR